MATPPRGPLDEAKRVRDTRPNIPLGRVFLKGCVKRVYFNILLAFKIFLWYTKYRGVILCRE